MSVLIKNVSMPCDCEVCKFFSVHESGCWLEYGKFISRPSERPKWCPLVEVPKHLEKKIEEYNEPLGLSWKEREDEV